MNVLISGGAKNGKSYYAQTLAKQMAEEQKVPLYYIATMIPHDEEDRARIRRHVSERAGWGFQTLEQGRNLPGLLCRAPADDAPSDSPGGAPADPKGVFLLDSVTALLSNEMFDAEGRVDPDAGERVAADCTAFARATGNTVFVSDYIYGDAETYDTMTEDYRRALAAVDRALAEACERVVEVAAGRIEEWKSSIGDAQERRDAEEQRDAEERRDTEERCDTEERHNTEEQRNTEERRDAEQR